jgi:predicted LPLAT superfamily acyltransferase
MLMGAHMGSFEVMHSLGRRNADCNVAMAMYEENARKINAILAAINPRVVRTSSPLGRIDSMLNIAERLDHGAFVGVLGDRTLGREPVQAVTLLGERAYVPTGPMRAAAILRCPVYSWSACTAARTISRRIRARRGFLRRRSAAARRGARRDRALCRAARSILPQRSLQLV